MCRLFESLFEVNSWKKIRIYIANLMLWRCITTNYLSFMELKKIEWVCRFEIVISVSIRTGDNILNFNSILLYAIVYTHLSHHFNITEMFACVCMFHLFLWSHWQFFLIWVCIVAHIGINVLVWLLQDFLNIHIKYIRNENILPLITYFNEFGHI